MLIYFCLGFTTLALLTYFDDGAVDVTQSIVVGSAMALFQIVRFGWDIYRDRREERELNGGPING
jgi:hypothetical protein